ncbi:MAG: Helix-turn-helix domain [Acidobacteriota bacterium]|jgi:transcriptional regulator with XRE-family HTH domain|nr:Helix-turn-helix domain [Acidobacteriota bacterium]MDT5061580.1 Helix-turn-helix domain [Acidobacteriota bacterium]
MGTRARHKPERFAGKLVQIRVALGLSQNEMIRRLGVETLVKQNAISEYELGKREPPLVILLQYARVAGVHMEALVDDELNLPEKLPGPVKYGEIERHYTSRRKSKR